MTDAAQPAGWETKPAPMYFGEDEQHPIADVRFSLDGAFDAGVEHRRAVGMWPPEYGLPFDDIVLPDET